MKTPSKQQKWVGPYTITRIHDHDTIEIKTIHKKELGWWRSIKFLPYDWVNPNQVITFDQDGMKILTSPDYDEVHHKMLECYSLHSLRIRTHDESITKIKPRVIIEFYPSKKKRYEPYTYDRRDTHQVCTIPHHHYDNKTCAEDVARTNHSHHRMPTTRSSNHICGK